MRAITKAPARICSDKTYVVVLRDPKGEMQGLSTAAVTDHLLDG